MKRILLSFTLMALLSNFALIIIEVFKADVGTTHPLHVDTCYLLKVIMILKVLFSFLLNLNIWGFSYIYPSFDYTQGGKINVTS